MTSPFRATRCEIRTPGGVAERFAALYAYFLKIQNSRINNLGAKNS